MPRLSISNVAKGQGRKRKESGHCFELLGWFEEESALRQSAYGGDLSVPVDGALQMRD